MDSIYNLLSFDLVHALSWTLLHSLWQGLLIACILSILIKHTQPVTSKSKSLISLGALVTLLIISIVTFFCYYEFSSVNEQATILVQGDWVTAASYLGSEKGQTYSTLTDYISEYSQYIVLAWLFGFALFLLHLLFGLFQLNRLKQQLVPVSSYWQDLLEGLANKLNYSGKVIMGESSRIQSPITFGLFKPVILFPVGMLNQLSIQEVEAIIAHELAHIVRKDYLVNFIQTVLEGIYYFNPGVWIISSIIRNQREHCCDDMAIALTGNSIHYLKALVAIEESKTESYLAMGFSSNKKPLLKRVQRILNQPQKNSNIKEKLIMTFILLIGFLVFSMDLNSKESIYESEAITILEDTAINEITLPSNISTTIDNIQSSPACQLSRSCQTKDTIPSKAYDIEYLDKDQKYINVPALEEQIKKSDVKIVIKDGDIEEMEIDGKDLTEEEISKIQYNMSEAEMDKLKNNPDIKIVVVESNDQDDEIRIGIREDLDRRKAAIRSEKENIKRDFERSKRDIVLDKEKMRNQVKAERQRIRSAVKKARTQAKKGVYSDSIYKDLEEIDIDFEDFGENLTENIREAFEDLDINFDGSQEERIRIAVDFAEELTEEMEEFEKELTEEMEELEFGFSEEMEEFGKELSEDMEELEKDLLDMQEDFIDMEEELMDDLDELIEIETQSSTSEIIEIIVNELLADNLIENRDEYSFLLKKNKFQVNGKSPSSSLKKKYESILEDLTDNEWSSNSKLKIVKKGTANFTEFSIKN